MSVSVERWGTSEDGRDCLLFTITGANGLSAKVTNQGAALVEVNVPDKSGKLANVNVRHAQSSDYTLNPGSLGAICGRYANRIRGAKFTLDGKEYHVTANSGKNHIHGGKIGFNKRIWSGSATDAGDGVVLRYRAADGEEGYPGNIDVEVTYRLTADGELRMEYAATSDQPTVLNLTNHAYWNLSGSGSGPILDHEMQISADRYCLADETGTVTGEVKPVADTSFDFTNPRPIGLHIGEVGKGYDHCYLVNGELGKLRPCAKVRDPKSGRVMEVLTTEPGVQFYTANNLKPEQSPHQQPQTSFCLECQHCPDSPNHAHFPSTVLRPGESYRQTTVHRFSTDM
ncbi:Aldose 1-epimerase precursor [Caulifigura coniformis]|uniref:Aldose 1-epimerase n=1 Tax=Caulifigura coniformis TaxID=2527983 RepID=A0A517SKX0_9PLAN|nr:aldose epimerase family protein [Caulifigura coniformis]QDT56764.1 Aldose 1-epimerase precursor [Caulifigura coniformis]